MNVAPNATDVSAGLALVKRCHASHLAEHEVDLLVRNSKIFALANELVDVVSTTEISPNRGFLPGVNFVAGTGFCKCFGCRWCNHKALLFAWSSLRSCLGGCLNVSLTMCLAFWWLLTTGATIICERCRRAL